MIEATSFISSSLKPRDVIAGVPIRTPEVTNGFSGSNGIAFLFAVMCTSSNKASASLPVRFSERTSNNNRWLSVPPETVLIPSASSASPKTFAFVMTCCAYVLNSGCNASPNATAFAAITCINGPP